MKTIGGKISKSLVNVYISSLKSKIGAAKQENKKEEEKTKKKNNGEKVRKSNKNKIKKRKSKQNGSNKNPRTKENKRNRTKENKNGNKKKKKGSKKKKKGSKKKKKNRGSKNKTKESKKKKKGSQKKWGTKKKTKQTTCSSTQADITCMTAALEGMLFEQNQITNYLKQSKLLQRHQILSGNKAGKKHQFREAGNYLLWAVGGNMSNPKCGPSDTSSSKYNRYFQS